MNWGFGTNFFVNGAEFEPNVDLASDVIFRTIWDSGGTDTYDFSRYSTTLQVDLRPGYWTNLGTQLAQLEDLQRPPGNIANARQFKGDPRSLIENAIGGSGNDRIIGNSASNTLNGGAGDDTLNGDTGNDTLNGGSDNDVLTGGQGADTMRGGAGNDAYSVDDVNDIVTENANEGIDLVNSSVSFTLSANLENLRLLFTGTGTGNDLSNSLTGSFGADTLLGGLGNDTLKGTLGNDTLDGGAGADWADFSDKTSAVIVTLNGGVVATVTVGDLIEDNVRNIEKVKGGSGDDTLTGDALRNTLLGGLGVDILSGGGDRDFLSGGPGNDTLNGGSGSSDTADYLNEGGLNGIRVTYSAPGSASVLDTFSNTDTLISVETIYGTNRDDIINGSSGTDNFLPARQRHN